ncbi:hypothetical protein GCM10022419_132690 [Nonomuraea rosea]|uniref:Uncharacterized protein n=1 Tax=Nonomuraea rosea TaxID=638574 RepID=A0ABP7A456_9ACTN
MDGVTATLRTASASAQVQWTEATVSQLTCVERAEREFLAQQLGPVAYRVGADWVSRFAVRTTGFAACTGVVLAAVLGSVLWLTQVFAGHPAAATSSLAYLLIIVVITPVYWNQAGRIMSRLAWISPERRRRFLLLYPVALAVAALLYGIVSVSAFHSGVQPAGTALFYFQEFAAFCVVAALGTVIAHLVLAYAFASSLEPAGHAQTLDWAWALAITAVTSWWHGVRTPIDARGDRRFDPCLLRLLGCAAAVDRMGRAARRASPREARFVLRVLEMAAADVERYALDQVPLFDQATRRVARHDGAQVASFVRNAKASIARGIHSGDYTAIAVGLTGFILAWARSDGHGLLAMVEEAAPVERAPLWKRIAGRTWNAVLLGAAGMLLPLLPFYQHDQAAAAGVRYALLTAAVLSLATTGVPVWGTVEKHLERSLSGGR